MRPSIKGSLRRMIEPIHWALALLPLYTALCAATLQNLFPAWICLGLTACFGCLIILFSRRRILFALTGMILMFLSIFPYRTSLILFLMPILSSVILLITASAKAMTEENMNPVFRTALGVMLYLISQYLAGRSDRPTMEHYALIQIPVLVGFLAFFLVELLIMNRQTIQSEATDRTVPASVSRNNLFYVIGLFVLTLLVASIPAIAQALSVCWAFIRNTIRVLARWLLSLLPEMVQGGGGGGEAASMSMEGIETAETSMLAIWMERIVFSVCAVALIYLIIRIGRIAWRKLGVLYRRLIAYLSDYMKSATDDYVDEVTDTRQTAEKHSGTLFGRRKRRPFRKDMSASEQIRYTYGLMIDRHPSWKSSATAREQLSETHASIYEKVRYAEKDASFEEAQSFSEVLQK